MEKERLFCTLKHGVPHSGNLRSTNPLVLLKSLLQDVPQLVKPNYDAVDIPKLCRMVDKCINNGVFMNEEKMEWLEFLQKEEELALGYEDVEEIVFRPGDGVCFFKSLIYGQLKFKSYLNQTMKEN